MLKMIRNMARDASGKVSEINKRYEKPRIKMTPPVKAVLFLLRLYLFSLVLILLYKFIATVGLLK